MDTYKRILNDYLAHLNVLDSLEEELENYFDWNHEGLSEEVFEALGQVESAMTLEKTRGEKKQAILEALRII